MRKIFNAFALMALTFASVSSSKHQFSQPKLDMRKTSGGGHHIYKSKKRKWYKLRKNNNRAQRKARALNYKRSK